MIGLKSFFVYEYDYNRNGHCAVAKEGEYSVCPDCPDRTRSYRLISDRLTIWRCAVCGAVKNDEGV